MDRVLRYPSEYFITSNV